MCISWGFYVSQTIALSEDTLTKWRKPKGLVLFWVFSERWEHLMDDHWLVTKVILAQ